MPISHSNGDFGDPGEEFGVDDAGRVLPVRPNFPQLATFWPGQYEIGEVADASGGVRHAVLPQISWRSTMPGVDGVTARKKHHEQERDRWRDRQTQDEQRGAIYLDPVKYRYQRRWACRDPQNGRRGYHYGTRWARASIVAGQGARFAFDRHAFNAWRLELMERGVLPRPSLEHVQPLIDEQQIDVDRLKSDARIPAERRAELVAKAERKLAEIRSAVAALNLAPEPEPGRVDDFDVGPTDDIVGAVDGAFATSVDDDEPVEELPRRGRRGRGGADVSP